MPEIDLYSMQGDNKGKVSLSEEVFAVPANNAVMHQALVRQLANRRRGTASTKTRGEVRGGGKKPWRQKGTGRARHGSIRSPLWKGGGITFGPRPRDFSKDMPKKMRRLALKCALSDKVFNNRVIALDQLVMEKPKTKAFVSMMEKLSLKESTLFITKDKDFSVEKSASNLPSAKVIDTGILNIHDLLRFDRLVITVDAIKKVEEVLG